MDAWRGEADAAGGQKVCREDVNEIHSVLRSIWEAGVTLDLNSKDKEDSAFKKEEEEEGFNRYFGKVSMRACVCMCVCVCVCAHDPASDYMSVLQPYEFKKKSYLL